MTEHVVQSGAKLSLPVRARFMGSVCVSCAVGWMRNPGVCVERQQFVAGRVTKSVWGAFLVETCGLMMCHSEVLGRSLAFKNAISAVQSNVVADGYQT
jgi:hypothetical protein